MIIDYFATIIFILIHFFETDLASGVVHFLTDKFLDKWMIPNDHHEFPRHQMWFLFFENFCCVCFTSGLDYFTTNMMQYSIYYWTCRSCLQFVVPFVHQYQHHITADDFLMRYKLVASYSNHRIHHIEFDKKFCLLNGWADFLVDRFETVPLIYKYPMISLLLYSVIRTVFYENISPFLLN